MTQTPQPPRVPSWLAPAVLGLLGLQLGLLYLQGFQLHQQRLEIRQLREDVQILAESLDAVPTEAPGEGPYLAPSRHRHRLVAKPSFSRVILEEDPEPAAKELENTRKEAQKAVQQGRETQQKLSIEENARKAEEKAKLAKEISPLKRYAGWGFGLVLVAILLRSILRRRAS